MGLNNKKKSQTLVCVPRQLQKLLPLLLLLFSSFWLNLEIRDIWRPRGWFCRDVGQLCTNLGRVATLSLEHVNLLDLHCVWQQQNWDARRDCLRCVSTRRQVPQVWSRPASRLPLHCQARTCTDLHWHYITIEWYSNTFTDADAYVHLLSLSLPVYLFRFSLLLLCTYCTS